MIHSIIRSVSRGKQKQNIIQKGKLPKNSMNPFLLGLRILNLIQLHIYKKENPPLLQIQNARLRDQAKDAETISNPHSATFTDVPISASSAAFRPFGLDHSLIFQLCSKPKKGTIFIDQFQIPCFNCMLEIRFPDIHLPRGLISTPHPSSDSISNIVSGQFFESLLNEWKVLWRVLRAFVSCD